MTLDYLPQIAYSSRMASRKTTTEATTTTTKSVGFIAFTETAWRQRQAVIAAYEARQAAELEAAAI